MAAYDFITFDCYGTLIDWESGIANAFIEAGAPHDRDTILRAYANAERAIESDTYRSYRDVLTEAALRVAETLGWALTKERARFLADSLPSWKPFLDTNPSLERLSAAGVGLGILSNTDGDLLMETQRHFPVEFDFVITADQVYSYKPRHPHFLATRNRIAQSSWLHAAESNFHDIVPTNTLGIPNAWINRKHESQLPGGAPTYEFYDLTGLAALNER
ncbi:MAG: putative hydrolase of the superfamily [Acidobacteriota bacterium]|jgi:2-haloalkanoic acid dehalogenase type II|nr:putative hydrolase of the superfamily [Acidobacteriota bacterium]